MIAWKREITHLIFIVEKFDVEKKKIQLNIRSVNTS
jgi:hypothetical protein